MWTGGGRTGSTHSTSPVGAITQQIAVPGYTALIAASRALTSAGLTAPRLLCFAPQINAAMGPVCVAWTP